MGTPRVSIESIPFTTFKHAVREAYTFEVDDHMGCIVEDDGLDTTPLRLLADGFFYEIQPASKVTAHDYGQYATYTVEMYDSFLEKTRVCRIKPLYRATIDQLLGIKS